MQMSLTFFKKKQTRKQYKLSLKGYFIYCIKENQAVQERPQ